MRINCDKRTCCRVVLWVRLEGKNVAQCRRGPEGDAWHRRRGKREMEDRLLAVPQYA